MPRRRPAARHRRPLAPPSTEWRRTPTARRPSSRPLRARGERASAPAPRRTLRRAPSGRARSSHADRASRSRTDARPRRERTTPIRSRSSRRMCGSRLRAATHPAVPRYRRWQSFGRRTPFGASHVGPSRRLARCSRVTSASEHRPFERLRRPGANHRLRARRRAPTRLAVRAPRRPALRRGAVRRTGRVRPDSRVLRRRTSRRGGLGRPTELCCPWRE